MEESNIPEAVKQTLEHYDKLRGKNVQELGVPFWDLVVLTARDEVQKEAYRLQIQAKISLKQLPLGVNYKLFADPPGPKVGCGGCTMYILTELKKQYGDKLYNWRILLINAGGFSQRLPSTSVLGKVFMALPIDKPKQYQLFDYKLACYLPFLANMKPGVFHAASDTIEVFHFGSSNETDCFRFDCEGFTAVAHPNTLNVGVNHGVFVLDRESAGEGSKTKLIDQYPCLEVLQKPSIGLMREKGAVVKDSKTGEECVYTDSCYFYDHSVTKKFIDFYEAEGPFDCELDSYGDYFQPLGPRATLDYVYNTSKVFKVVDSLIPMRKKLFQLLKGVPLQVIILNESKFYHVGACKDYLYYFCSDEVFAKELNCSRETFCVFPCEKSDGEPQDPLPETHHEGVLTHSIIPHSSTIANTAVLEYCQFGVPIHASANCIVSNCALSDDHTLEKSIQIAANTFLHTVPVKKPDGYCTILFKIDDDIKQKVSNIENLRDMKYLEKPLAYFIKALHLSCDEDLLDVNHKGENICVWNAKLFPVMDTMSHSFLAALQILHAVENGEEIKDEIVKKARLFSMADIMEAKNVEDMIGYRSDLYSCITAHTAHVLHRQLSRDIQRQISADMDGFN